MEGEKAYSLIVQNLQEVVGISELKNALQEGNRRAFEVYWGTATTGRPHIAYFVPICKIADMLHAGAKVTVLFADLHAYLDNMKSPWSVLYHRATYYETVIKAMLESVGVRLNQLHFIRGSDYELARKYSEDVYRISADTTIRDARKAGAEVVKQVANPLVSGLLYPLLQALDEEYLHVDAQFGGVDQRKIFMLCERILPKLGYKKRIHLMNPMVPGLTGGKMSASDATSKIDLLDSSDDLRAKLKSASCPPGQTAADGNGVLGFIKYVVFPLVRLAEADSRLTINGKRFSTFEELEAAYIAGDASVTAETLKDCIFKELDPRMEVIRRRFKEPEFAFLLSAAYPVDETACAAEHATESPGESLAIRNDHLTTLKKNLDQKQQEMPKTEEKPGILGAATVFGLNKDTAVQSLTGRVVRILWSVKPTGIPHLGLYLPIRDLALFSKHSGFHIIVLIDDIGAFCEGKCPWKLRKARCQLYEAVVTSLFKTAAADLKNVSIVCSSDFKCEGSYMLDLYRIVSLVPENDALTCSGAVSSAQIKALESGELEDESIITSLSTLLLPCMTLLDTYHLRADIRVASPDSIKKQEQFASKVLPRFDAKFKMPFYSANKMLPALRSSADITLLPCTEMCPFIPPLRNPKVSRSVGAQAQAKAVADQCIPLVEPAPPGTDISSLSDNSTFVMPGLKRRLKQTFCAPGDEKHNPLMEILKILVIPELSRDASDHITLPRAPKHGGPITLKLDECRPGPDGKCRLNDLFAREDLHPGDLKAGLEELLETHFRSRLAKFLPEAKKLEALINGAFPIPNRRSKSRVKSTKRKITEKCLKPRDGDGVTSIFDPFLLEFTVGEIVSVNPHPKSSNYSVCHVFFGDSLKKTSVSVTSMPQDALLNKKAIFMTNLKEGKIEGITSEVKIVCVSESRVFEIQDRPAGTKMRFKLIGKDGVPKAKASSNPVNIDYEGHPKWKAFFSDVYVGNGTLCWRNNWRLMAV